MEHTDKMGGTNFDDETKADRFTRLAVKRVDKAVKAIKLVAALTNKGNYEWTDEQGVSIVKALDAEMLDLENALKGVKITASSFKF